MSLPPFIATARSRMELPLGILLGLAPFLAFMLIEWTVGTAEGLFAGALVAAALLLRGLMAARRSVKLLEIGAAVLFGGLAVCTPMSDASWSAANVRLFVDAGFLATMLLSMAVRRPFTLQYARAGASPDQRHGAAFLHTNYVVTAAWAAAFLAMVATDLAMHYLPGVPADTGIAATMLALIGAMKFTAAYPIFARRAAAGK